jgi:hypothetical protein
MLLIRQTGYVSLRAARRKGLHKSFQIGRDNLARHRKSGKEGAYFRPAAELSSVLIALVKKIPVAVRRLQEDR